MTGPTAGPAEGTYRHATYPRRRWCGNKTSIVLNGWIALLLATSATDGYITSMINALQFLPQWKQSFGYPTGGRLGLLNMIQHVGVLGGHVFAPYVSDGVGRRYTILLGASTTIFATGIQMGTQSIGMFISARLLVGFGIAFSINAAPVLVAELVHPAHRASMTSIHHSLWYTGAIVAAWTTFGSFMFKSTWAWRIPSAFQALPSILQVFFVLSLPESPRWLITKGKYEQAKKTLAYCYADGNENDTSVKDEFEEISASVRAGTPNVGWTSLLSTPGHRKRLRLIMALAIFSQWSGNGLISYYLSNMFDLINITDPTTQLLINGALQVWKLFWALWASTLTERLGRRFLFLSSACGMLLSLALQTFFSSLFAHNESRIIAHAVIAFIFLFCAFYDIAFTPLIMTYTIEILPNHSRAKNFNIFNVTVQIAAIINKYVNPIALDYFGWKCYIIYVCWLAFEVVFLYFFIIETKNMTLEQTAALFDEVSSEQIP